MDKATEKSLDKLIEVVVQSIPKEHEAHDLYLGASKYAVNEMTRLLFEKLAQDELQHAAKLKAVLELLNNEKKRLSGKK